MTGGAFTPMHHGGSGPPLVLIHGFTDTWRSWELILPELERHHEVLAVTLTGHAGGPAMPAALSHAVMADGVIAAMDELGWDDAHIAGNSLGGYVALQLAARGKARTVVALAPAGGWAEGDTSFLETLGFFETMQDLVKQAAPHADAIMATPEGRRRSTEFTTVNYEHLPPDLLAHQLRGSAACEAAAPLIAFARTDGWALDPEPVDCPVRFVWGTEDRLLLWPSSAQRYQDWFPTADWVVLDDVGHCPQLDVPTETAQLILGLTKD